MLYQHYIAQACEQIAIRVKIQAMLHLDSKNLIGSSDMIMRFFCSCIWSSSPRIIPRSASVLHHGIDA